MRSLTRLTRGTDSDWRERRFVVLRLLRELRGLDASNALREHWDANQESFLNAVVLDAWSRWTPPEADELLGIAYMVRNMEIGNGMPVRFFSDAPAEYDPQTRKALSRAQVLARATRTERSPSATCFKPWRSPVR